MASSTPVDVVSLEGVTIIPVYQFTNDDSPLLLQLRGLDTTLSFQFFDFPILKIACWRVRFTDGDTWVEGLLRDSTDARQLSLSAEYTIAVTNIFPITVRFCNAENCIELN